MSGHEASRPAFDYVATTRRRWSKSQKQAILAEVDAPGGSVSEVARRHGLHTSLLFRWRRDLAKPAAPSVSQPPTFVPLSLPAPLPPPSSPPPPARTEPIEIVLAGGRTVRVSTGVDVFALRRLLDALEGHAEGVREKSR
jgi:transposase